MEHEDLQNLGTGRLLWVIVFNLVISAAEIIGGLVSGSLALISDAMHNTSDISIHRLQLCDAANFAKAQKQIENLWLWPG